MQRTIAFYKSKDGTTYVKVSGLFTNRPTPQELKQVKEITGGTVVGIGHLEYNEILKTENKC